MSDPPVVADTVDATTLLRVLAQVKRGDFTARMPLEWTGMAGKVADGLNEVIIANQALETELARVSEVVGQQGKSLAEELRESNEDLGRQATLLAEQNIEAERTNHEIERSKRLVEEKAGEIAASSKYKSEFIANMSHELRTPLNSLLILAELLEDNPDHTMTDTQVEYASVILASGRSLLGLLNSILDLAKAESGTVTVEMTDVSVEELRNDLLREFEPVAQGQHLGYSIDIAPGGPDDIVTDPQRLRQILKNLLANAFKFTERGEVHVQIGLADEGWSQGTASLARASSVMALRISDTGIGIGEGEQQGIFEAFAQADGTSARQYGGTGLGLSISRELAGLLGGEITVVSTPGQGSAFTVYLPLDRPLDRPPSPETPSPVIAANEVAASDPRPRPDRDRPNDLDDRPFEGAKVLVVDDDFRNCFALTALLERGHADVTIAESGPEAIATLKRVPDIDIVLMDIMMPGMDGYTAIRAIRTLDDFTSVPIIAVTGKVVRGERERCIEAGADDYVPKPVDSVALLAALKPWLPTTVRSLA